MFQVGQLVVYVGNRGALALPPITKGTVCTVSETGLGISGLGIAIRESNFPPEYLGWDPRKFRPVDDSKLAIFRAALVPGPRQRVRA